MVQWRTVGFSVLISDMNNGDQGGSVEVRWAVHWR